MSTATELKEAGMEKVALNNEEFLDTIRKFASRYATEHGSVTTDDLHKYADAFGVYPKHHNAWGAVFAQKHLWTPIGYQPSERPESHARII